MRRTLFTMAVGGALLSLAARAVGAQSVTGRLEGKITERSNSRAASAASVSVARVNADSVVSRTVRPDSSGRYRLDSLAAGRYVVSVETPLLDSLGLAIPDRELLITAGQVTQLNDTLPFGAALRDAVCPRVTLGKGRGVVAGHAIDAATDRPLEGAKVVVSWSDIAVDTTLSLTTTGQRVASVKTGSRGEYRLCGVPTGAWLVMQLQAGDRAGSAIRVTFSDDDGAIARDLSLNMATAGADSTVANTSKKGTARLTGSVRTTSGAPIEYAEASVQGADASASTDSEGQFTLSGLSDGTQTLVVRRLGYTLAEIPVELRSGRSVNRDVQLSRIVSLDTVVVSAYRTRYHEFFFNRGIYMMAGDFLTAEMIAERDAEETGDLVDRMPGFNVVGRGGAARVYTNKTTVAGTGCTANVVIDGREGMRVNDVVPAQVQGIETYVNKPLPSIYVRDGCGLVVIWTTRWRRPTKAP